jgi:hypothetical protein
MKHITFTALCALALFLQTSYAKDTISVYFIGNSLTQDVPEPLMALMDNGNTWVKVEWSSLFMGGSYLSGHWTDRNAEQKIRDGKYDYVVLQEGKYPEYFLRTDPETRQTIETWIKTYMDVIHEVGSEGIVYCTMGFDTDPMAANDTFIAVQERASKANNAIFAPIGAVARQAILENPQIDLWSDGVHNNALGLYLIACTFYCIFTGETPVGNTYYGAGTMAQVSASDAAWAQALAWRVMSTQYPQYLSWIKNSRTASKVTGKPHYSSRLAAVDFQWNTGINSIHYGVLISNKHGSCFDISGRLAGKAISKILRNMP